jgi:hypothetical protein
MDLPLSPWAGTCLVVVLMFGAFMYLFNGKKAEPSEPDAQVTLEQTNAAATDGGDRSAVHEYLVGLKHLALMLLSSFSGPVAMAVSMGWFVFAIVGIFDLLGGDVFSVQWKRVASWISIIFWVGFIVVSHVKSVRQKGRNVLDHKR